MKVTIKVKNGFDARKCTQLVRTASNYCSDIKLVKNQRSIDVKSIMGLLSLLIKPDDEIILNVNGQDEIEAVDALTPIIA